MTDFTTPYIPRIAEDGKFVPIDATTLSTLGYPASGGMGRFAILTYNVGAAGTVGGTGTANNTVIYSGTYSNSATVITAPSAAPFSYLEVYNNSGDNAYVMVSATSYNSLTSQGIVLLPASFYSISRVINAFTIGTAVSTVNLRVIAHNRV